MLLVPWTRVGMIGPDQAASGSMTKWEDVMRKLATFLTAKGGASKDTRKLSKTLLGGGLGLLLAFALLTSMGQAQANTARAKNAVTPAFTKLFFMSILPCN